ncbi:hypothetical protein M011DRAFT_463231 [Sporormia fimetaria CBS 119925]|uniref:Uncharacterized protein n=1 Tax=Sporormia fimetaria CBS 119925 TaxID=1340428 RepID=A0A6A6VPJ8_9PLEO|nr:hypothetical protein M011DRAFT_463231 [Sporormia fimetaria CBS 119925]
MFAETHQSTSARCTTIQNTWQSLRSKHPFHASATPLRFAGLIALAIRFCACVKWLFGVFMYDVASRA